MEARRRLQLSSFSFEQLAWNVQTGCNGFSLRPTRQVSALHLAAKQYRQRPHTLLSEIKDIVVSYRAPCVSNRKHTRDATCGEQNDAPSKLIEHLEWLSVYWKWHRDSKWYIKTSPKNWAFTLILWPQLHFAFIFIWMRIKWSHPACKLWGSRHIEYRRVRWNCTFVRPILRTFKSLYTYA